MKKFYIPSEDRFADWLKNLHALAEENRERFRLQDEDLAPTLAALTSYKEIVQAIEVAEERERSAQEWAKRVMEGSRGAEQALSETLKRVAEAQLALDECAIRAAAAQQEFEAVNHHIGDAKSQLDSARIETQRAYKRASVAYDAGIETVVPLTEHLRHHMRMTDELRSRMGLSPDEPESPARAPEPERPRLAAPANLRAQIKTERVGMTRTNCDCLVAWNYTGATDGIVFEVYSATGRLGRAGSAFAFEPTEADFKRIATVPAAANLAFGTLTFVDHLGPHQRGLPKAYRVRAICNDDTGVFSEILRVDC